MNDDHANGALLQNWKSSGTTLYTAEVRAHRSLTASYAILALSPQHLAEFPDNKARPGVVRGIGLRSSPGPPIAKDERPSFRLAIPYGVGPRCDRSSMYGQSRHRESFAFANGVFNPRKRWHRRDVNGRRSADWTIVDMVQILVALCEIIQNI